ncbi:hypothetical protein Trydic_g9327 [Trypoxylus dichotomus]
MLLCCRKGSLKEAIPTTDESSSQNIQFRRLPTLRKRRVANELSPFSKLPPMENISYLEKPIFGSFSPESSLLYPDHDALGLGIRSGLISSRQVAEQFPLSARRK